jgi:hypothetical protein
MARGLVRPSYATGLARTADEAEFPDLWPGLRFGWAPSAMPGGGNLAPGAVRNSPAVTLTSGITWGINAGVPPLGPGNQAPIFNGTSHAGQTALALDLTDATRLSVSFWLYWDSFANDDDLCWESSANFNSNAGGILCDPGESVSGLFGIGIRNSLATANSAIGFTRPTGAAWHHYLVTMDLGQWANGASGGVYQVWVDGTAQSLSDLASSTIANAPSSFGNYVWYWMSRGAASLFGDGRLGDFFIWANRILGARDAVRLWQGESPLHLRAATRGRAPVGNVFTAAGGLAVGAATAAGSATFAAGTKTATGSLTVGHATASGSATFATPTYTASGGPAVGAASAAASATFAPGTKTASGAPTVGAATASGSATFSPGTKTAAGAAAAGAATASGIATFAAGTRTASGALTAASATAAASATFATPTYTASGTPATAPVTASGSAVFATVVFQASGAAAAGKATAAGSATFAAPVYAGSAALNSPPATAAGSAQHTPPTYTGSGAVTGPATTANALAMFAAAGSRTASGVFNVAPATAGGIATFVAPAIDNRSGTGAASRNATGTGAASRNATGIGRAEGVTGSGRAPNS